MLLVKCFEHHLTGKIIQQNGLWAMTLWQNMLEISTIYHKGDLFTSSAFWLGLFMTKMNALEMTVGKVFNLQDFEQNKIKFKQRSIEDFNGNLLIDADLLLIWMNKFQLWFRFHRECPYPIVDFLHLFNHQNRQP